jgi:hypothetical protein
MNRVKKFLKYNKEEMKVLAYGTVMMFGGIYIGKKYSNVEWNNMLLKSADTNSKLYKVIDNKLYTISILKEQL